MDVLSTISEIVEIVSSVWDAIAAVVSIAVATVFGIRSKRFHKWVRWGLAGLFLATVAGVGYYLIAQKSSQLAATAVLPEITIGSKDFLESAILAEMLAHHIRGRFPTINIHREYGIGDTGVLQSRLRDDMIDLYPEYTGTALTQLVGLEPSYVAQGSLHTKKTLNRWFEQEARTSKLRALDLFGFSNDYVMVIPSAKYQELCAGADNCKKTISWLSMASRKVALRVGSMNWFMHRSDGLPELRRVYGFELAKFEIIHHEAKYRQLAKGELDAIIGFATDPQLLDPAYIVLSDDSSLWPSYFAFPLIRKNLLNNFPELAEALQPLSGSISDRDIQSLIKQANAADVTMDKLAIGQTSALERIVFQFFAARKKDKPEVSINTSQG